MIDDYKNGYGLDDETYEILLERLYGYEEYYYYKQDKHYKDYIFITKELDKIRYNKPMDVAYKNAIIGWYISFKNLNRRINYKYTHFIITDACNLKCTHCYRQKLPRNGNYMSYEEFMFTYFKSLELSKHFVHYDKINKQTKTIIGLTGGEATLNKDLPKMIDFLNKQNVIVYLNSNGIDVPDEVIQVLNKGKNNEIILSLDGLKETHDSIRGNGTFEKTIDSIKKLKSYDNIITNINCTIHSKNYTEFLDVLSYAKSINPNITHKCVLYNEQFTHNEFSSLKNDRTMLEEGISFLQQKSFNKNGLQHNSIGTKLFVNYDGNIIMNPYYYTKNQYIANLFNDDMDTILHNLKKYIIKVRSVPVYCFDCKSVDFCLGGLSKENLKRYGKYNLEDDCCRILEKKEVGDMYEV